MLDAALDLLLGSTCAGCEAPGRMLCRDCRADLPGTARVAWPSPVPTGLVQPWSVASYDGAVRALVVGHKDRGQLAHRRVLGGLLARSVAAAIEGLRDDHPVVLVPVPSRPGSSRRRGYDPMGALTTTAARTLRHGADVGADVRVDVRAAPLLVSRGAVTDQAGLGAMERAANMAGSMTCPSRAVRRLHRQLAGRSGSSGPGGPFAHVVLCDDVLTTGATAREAQRALTAVGLPPVAVATIAATVRHGSDAA